MKPSKRFSGLPVPPLSPPTQRYGKRKSPWRRRGGGSRRSGARTACSPPRLPGRDGEDEAGRGGDRRKTARGSVAVFEQVAVGEAGVEKLLAVGVGRVALLQGHAGAEDRSVRHPSTPILGKFHEKAAPGGAANRSVGCFLVQAER